MRTNSYPVVARTRRGRPVGPPAGHNLRPPRYRLLAAAAALPRRESNAASETFERDCPACGRTVVFTQLHGDDGVEYGIEDHECREPQRLVGPA